MPDTTTPNPLVLAHQMSKAKYEKLLEGQQHLDNLRLELDSLTKLGDMVSPDDVVKSASNLVAKGFDPHELAVMLSGMPAGGGEMLQSWIGTQDQHIRMLEKNAGPMIQQARHQMTVNAGHVLAEDHSNRTGQQLPQAAPQQQMGMAQAGSAAAPPQLSASSPVMGSA